MDLKKDFPCLNQEMDGMPVVYLDSACMSLKPRCVIDKMVEYYTQYSGCGGRSAHKFSSRTTEEVVKARKNISDFIGAKNPNQIIFTKNTQSPKASSLVFAPLWLIQKCFPKEPVCWE